MNARTRDGQGPCSVRSYRECLRSQVPMPMLQVFKRWLPRWESLISTSGCLSMMMCFRIFLASRDSFSMVAWLFFKFAQFVSWVCIFSSRMLHNSTFDGWSHIRWASAKAIDLHSRAGQQLVELVQTKVKAEFGNEVFGMLDALSECMEKISKDRNPVTGRCHKMSQISQDGSRCPEFQRHWTASVFVTRTGHFFPGAIWLRLNGSCELLSSLIVDSTTGAETERGKIWLDHGASAGQFLSDLDSFAATSIADGFPSSAQVAMQHNTLKPPEHEGQIIKKNGENMWT